MVDYLKLGFKTNEEYLDEFFDTLLGSNRTYEYYVDWEKIINNLKASLIEISILNSLNKVSSDELEDKFSEIIKNYRKVVPLLPLILAIRDKKVPVFDLEEKDYKIIDFSKNRFKHDEIVEFAIKTGLLDLFNKIDDLYSYLMGVEVGLDTNARKNRSGHIFEDVVGELLEEEFKNKTNVRINKEDSSLNIDRIKRFDYVVYVDNKPKYAIECNFYNSTGSKPIEVAHAYANLQKDLDKHDIKFIWVTDGFGWNKMNQTVKNVEPDIEYLVNYRMLVNHFNEIFDI